MLEKIFKFFGVTIQSLLSILKVLLRSSFLLAKTKASKTDLFILGNGPSLKKAIEEQAVQLKKQELLCVNAFPNTIFFTLLKPRYYLILSKGFYNDQAVDYNVSVRKKIIESLIKTTDWPLIVFLPAKAKKNRLFIQSLKQNKHLELSYYNETAVDGLPFVNHIFYSKGLGMPRPHNVLIPALLKGINLGFKKIYLLGSDHSWIPQLSVTKENNVLLNQKHFYDENTSKARPMHKNEGQGQRKLHEVLEKFYFSFRSYHDIAAYAKVKSCKIINLVPDSFIDAFDKEELKDILNEK